MRDHRGEMTPEEKQAMQRAYEDITAPMREFSRRAEMTPARRAKRNAKRKQQAASRRTNRP